MASAHDRVPLVDAQSALSDDRPLRLAEGDVHLWVLALEGDASLIERCRQMLSPDEQQRAGRFVFSRDREQFILAHALLRHVLSRYLGLPAGGIAFESGAAGKPALVCPAVPVSFNLSHSHGRAAIAVSDGRDIGVDLEFERADIGFLDIAGSNFSASELDAVRSAAPGEQCSVFFRYWVAKEAVLKAEGVGLGFPPEKLEILFAQDRSSARVRSSDATVIRHDWTIRLFSLGEGWPLAVCAGGANWRVRLSSDL